jgi:class 3 adenylate cyclase
VLCLSCQAENKEGARYCRECGSALALTCPSCGTPRDPGQAFCDQCGAALDAAAQSQPAAGPELRVASVLFVDLVGYTPLTETRDVEDVRELLSAYFDLTRTIVDRYGGTVEKFIGDAVMAVWGAPVARGDDAERAVRAGLELVDAVARFGDAAGAPLQARAGVATGQVAALENPGEGLVIGDRVNTASRVQAAAAPGTVFVDDATRSGAAAAIAFEDAGEHTVKGKTEPVHLHRAVRVIGGAAGTQLRTGLEPPFVGRAGELRLMKDLFHASIDRGVARLVVVSGPAGIGKTRLGTELTNYVDGLAVEIAWHFGRCVAFGDGVTYSALADMVRQRLAIGDDTPADEVGARIAAGLERLLDQPAERERIAEAFGALLATADPGFARDELFAAWRLFFERLSERDPVVLVFEDLHWADEGLLDFLEQLLDWSSEHPIFVCCFARPEVAARRAGWPAGVANATTMTLEPLAPDEIAELLDGTVANLPGPLRRRIVDHAEGVPLYAVETVRALADRSMLAERDEGLALAAEVGELDVPPSLHSLLSARLDALSAAERELVKAMAVFGVRFNRASAAALAGLPGERLDEVLASLVGREILSIATDPLSAERGQYAFAQSMLRAVAYEMIGRRERKALHLSAAGYLRDDAADQREDVAELVAAHLLGALRAASGDADEPELRERAIAALRDASQRAATVGAPEAASRALRTAADLAGDEGERAALTAEAGRRAAEAGDYPVALELLEHASAAHLDVGRERDAARLAAAIGHTRGRLGDYEAGIEDMRAAQAVLGDDERDPDVARLWCDLARALLFTEHADEAGPLLDRSLAAAEALELHDLTCIALDLKAICMEYEGRFLEARALHEAAFEIGERHRISRSHVALNNVAVLQVIRDMPEAGEACERAIEACRGRGDRSGESLAIGNLMAAQLFAGEWAASAEIAARAIADDARRPDVEYIQRQLGVLQVLRGELAEARSSLEAAGALAHHDDIEARHDHSTLAGLLAVAEGDHASGLDLLAATSREAVAGQGASSENLRLAWPAAVAAAIAVGRPGEARSLIELLESMPAGHLSPLLRAELDRARGLVATADGRLDEAERRLAAAVDAFAELDYPFWVARTSADLASVLIEAGRGAEAALRLESVIEPLVELGAEPELDRVRGLLERAVTAEAR